MKNWKVFTAGALFALAGLSGASAQDMQEVKVGFAAEPYPPFTSQEASGQWVGWEVEFAEAVCAEAKLNCVITPVAWDGIIPALTSQKIDMIVGSMSITPEREKTIAFTDKYYNTPTAIIGPKDAEFEATPEGLSGKVLGVQTATTHAAYARKHFGDTAAEIKEYQTQDEANQDLAAGRLDAVQADSIALDAFVKSDAGQCCEIKGMVEEDVEVLGPGVGIGLRQEDTELKEKLNAAIQAIRTNGKYDEITKKYFDFDIYGG